MVLITTTLVLAALVSALLARRATALEPAPTVGTARLLAGPMAPRVRADARLGLSLAGRTGFVEAVVSPDRAFAWVGDDLREVRTVAGGPLSAGDRIRIVGARAGTPLVEVANAAWA